LWWRATWVGAEVVVASDDAVVQHVHLGLVEGEAAAEHRVQADAQAPHVDALAEVAAPLVRVRVRVRVIGLGLGL
jgi:hypothetical protein